MGPPWLVRRVLREKSRSCGEWDLHPLTTQEMADLEHIRVALHFFSNATQNPLPPGGRPSGWCPRAEQVVPSQETRKLESGNAIINPQAAGGGSPGLHQAWQEKQTALELCGPLCPQDCEGLRRQAERIPAHLQASAIFSSLIPVGACRAHGFEEKAGERTLYNSLHTSS